MDLYRILTPIIFILFWVCAFHRASVLGTDTTTRSGAPRIVGGGPCEVTEYPFVVSVYNFFEINPDYPDQPIFFTCGGTLLTFQWVMTAAHCFFPQGFRITVTSGFSRNEYHQQRDVLRFVVHSRFNSERFEDPKDPETRFDIGLILLKQPFQEGPACNLVVLPEAGFTRYCKMGKVLGIGKEEISYGKSLRAEERKPLKCVDLHITDLKTCSKSWPGYYLDHTVMCTLEKVYGKDACLGDSGGPLICNENVVIGIVSAGKGCGMANVAAIFTKVESHLEFISSITKIKLEHGVSRKNTTSRGVTKDIWNLIHVTAFCFCCLNLILILYTF